MKREKKVIYTGRYLKLIINQGWEYIQRCSCRGVVIIVAVTPDQQVLLTEQFRLPVERSVIEYPAGLVADRPGIKNETLLTAAKRELLEETGYAARRFFVLTAGPAASGSSSVILTFVHAQGLYKKQTGGGDATECITVHAVPLKRIEAWLEEKKHAGCLVDPKIYAGLYFLNKYNKKKFNKRVKAKGAGR